MLSKRKNYFYAYRFRKCTKDSSVLKTKLMFLSCHIFLKQVTVDPRIQAIVELLSKRKIKFYASLFRKVTKDSSVLMARLMHSCIVEDVDRIKSFQEEKIISRLSKNMKKLCFDCSRLQKNHLVVVKRSIKCENICPCKKEKMSHCNLLIYQLATMNETELSHNKVHYRKT